MSSIFRLVGCGVAMTLHRNATLIIRPFDPMGAARSGTPSFLFNLSYIIYWFQVIPNKSTPLSLSVFALKFEEVILSGAACVPSDDTLKERSARENERLSHWRYMGPLHAAYRLRGLSPRGMDERGRKVPRFFN